MHGIGLTVLSILFVLLWSSGWTASHYAVTSSSALSILSARYVIVVAILLVVVTLLRQWQHLSRREFLLHLTIGALCHAFYLLGCISAFELGVSAAVVAFVNSLQPMATASITGIVSGSFTEIRHYKGLLLGAMSVALIVSDSLYHSDTPSFALALPFIAMIALSTGIVLNRRQEVRACNSRQQSRPVMLLLLIHTIGAAIVIVPLAAVQGELKWQFTNSELKAIIWLALVVSLGAYALLLFLLKHISAVRVSSLTYLVPPATMLQSYVFFGEALSLTDAVAISIASVAVYMILTHPPKVAKPFQGSMSGAELAQHRLTGNDHLAQDQGHQR